MLVPKATPHRIPRRPLAVVSAVEYRNCGHSGLSITTLWVAPSAPSTISDQAQQPSHHLAAINLDIPS